LLFKSSPLTMSDGTQSSWWGYASSAWTTIQETAKDFSEAIQEENEETIQNIKARVDESQTLQSIKHSIQNNVDSERITTQISSASHSLNKLVRSTVHTLQSSMASPDTAHSHRIRKSTVAVKPFEKERATYSSDPYAMAQHQDKFRVFIDSELGLNDAEIALKGRSLLEVNGVIRSFFEQLVPDEVDEVTFWKRYFYWKYQWQLREIMISRHSAHESKESKDLKNSKDLKDSKEFKESKDADDDAVDLGDCENAKGTLQKQVIPDRNGNGSEMECKDEVLGSNVVSGSGSRFSETSWTNATAQTTRTETLEEEVMSTTLCAEEAADDRKNDGMRNVEDGVVAIGLADKEDDGAEMVKQDGDRNGHEEPKAVDTKESESQRENENENEDEDVEEEEDGDESWADWD